MFEVLSIYMSMWMFSPERCRTLSRTCCRTQCCTRCPVGKWYVLGHSSHHHHHHHHHRHHHHHHHHHHHDGEMGRGRSCFGFIWIELPVRCIHFNAKLIWGWWPWPSSRDTKIQNRDPHVYTWFSKISKIAKIMKDVTWFGEGWRRAFDSR